MAQTQQRYDILSNANKAMTNRANQLQTDAEIERLAREQYELVPPGQEAFAMMPSTGAVVGTTPAPQPKQKQSTVAQVWDDITFWN